MLYLPRPINSNLTLPKWNILASNDGTTTTPASLDCPKPSCPCVDVLPPEKCEKRRRNGNCHKLGNQRKCRKTCGLCKLACTVLGRLLLNWTHRDSITSLKYQFWKNVTSEKWNSDGLNTFTTYLSSLLGVIAEYNSNHAQKWRQICCKGVQPVRVSFFRSDILSKLVL